MSKTHAAIGLAFAATFAVSPSHAKKTTLEVGTCVAGQPTFSTIGDAVGSAAKGAVIEICPGNYPEQIAITKNLTLTAIGTNGTTSGSSSLVHITVPAGGFAANATDPDRSGQPVAAQLFIAPGVTAKVVGLGFDASGSTFTDCSTNLVGIFVEGATATLQNNAVLNDTLGGGLTGCQNGEGILAESGGGTAKTTISGNHIAGFDKNGITIKDAGTTATVTGNTIQGGGAATVAAQNGIEVSTGAAATLSKNLIADFVYGGAANAAASSVLIYDAPGATIRNNVINEGQYGIIVYGDGTSSADNPTITNNMVAHMTLTDSVEICGASGATVTNNTISGSQLSAIHIDSSCSNSGATNVSGNRINYACAGVLNGTGGSSIGKNTFLNTGADVLTSDSCPSTQDSMRRARRLSQRR